MIPKKIQPHCRIIYVKEEDDTVLTEGICTCCNTSEFLVWISGELKHGFFTKMYLVPKNEWMAVNVQCTKCNKMISVYDSNSDGYDNVEYHQYTIKRDQPQIVFCKKCRGSNFSLSIKYEYSGIQELRELGIMEIDNAFSWIWCTLECINCGTKYRHFVDHETG